MNWQDFLNATPWERRRCLINCIIQRPKDNIEQHIEFAFPFKLSWRELEIYLCLDKNSLGEIQDYNALNNESVNIRTIHECIDYNAELAYANWMDAKRNEALIEYVKFAKKNS